jgi:peptide deformylase
MQALINPEITSRSSSTAVAEEGCLSLPGVWLPITRSTEITLQFVTMDGKPRELLLKDFDARVIQHEVDHLDGVLITDHKREVVM